MAGAVVLSAQVTTKFRAERQRLEAAFDLKGLTERQIFHNRDLNPFASPGIRIQKLLPGSSLAVTVRGDFPSGTTILSERDGVTLSAAALSATTYSARLTIPPDEGPGFVRLWAFTLIGGIEGSTAVALVDTLYRFDLKSPNGYTVKIAPVEKTFTIRDNKFAKVQVPGGVLQARRGKAVRNGDRRPDVLRWRRAAREPHALRQARNLVRPVDVVAAGGNRSHQQEDGRSEDHRSRTQRTDGTHGRGPAEDARRHDQGFPDRSGELEQEAG